MELEYAFEGLEFVKSGKVREIYKIEDMFLMVATDRISCFDVVLPSQIPLKGEILTRISVFWFDFLKDIIKNHFITTDVNQYPEEIREYADILDGRSMLVKCADAIPVECVVRGYLSGSGWKEYQQNGEVCGVKLPKNLKESDKLPEPIFTPATKESSGHDINVSEEYVRNELGEEVTNTLKEKSLAIYKKASAHAESKGVIIADTKFEFGWIDGEICLIDEVLTPDSSRFWPKNQYTPGKTQPSFDKQIVRNYLETLDWDKTYPGPELPKDIMEQTTKEYIHAYELLTGTTFSAK